MQINRHHTFDKSPVSHPLAKSKSPENFRQKIPTFKPKTLEEIFEETKRKKSSDKQDKDPDNLRTSAKYVKKVPIEKQQKPAKNSLADLIAESGHNDDIESIEYTNSQIEEHFPEQDLEKYLTQQYRQPKKYEVRVFTPQAVPFSKLGKDVNLFKCKDDFCIVEEEPEPKMNHWNGEITLATSMCEEDFQKITQEDTEVPKDYHAFVDERCFYVLCVNSQNQNEHLIESTGSLSLEKLMEKMRQLEGGNRINGKGKKSSQGNQKIKFLSLAEMDEFLAPQDTHGHIESYLKQNLGKKKFMTVIYYVEASSVSGSESK